MGNVIFVDFSVGCEFRGHTQTYQQIMEAFKQKIDWPLMYWYADNIEWLEKEIQRKIEIPF